MKRTSGKAFFDTNIFIYLYSDSERDKQAVCKEIINGAVDCVTSTQILNEINNVLIKKWHTPIETVKAIQKDVRGISDVRCVNEDTIDRAIELNARYGFSYYDCLMLASALESGCDMLYTEDMSDGQLIEESLKIVNPFAGTKCDS